MRFRNEIVKCAQSFIGKKESDGSYKTIIDLYNSYKGVFPRGLKMRYEWAWCACFWSSLAIKCGYTDIIPIEISCAELIKLAKKMGIWVESDTYVPKPGDAVLYDWNDSGKGDNTGIPDHIGVVEYVNYTSGYFVVIEGNYNDEVKRRTVSINGKFIRGFITPKYDEVIDEPKDTATGTDLKTVIMDVIAGKYGNGSVRREKITALGYNYDEVQAMVTKTLNGSAVVSKNPIQDQSQPIEKKVMATCSAKKFDQNLSETYKTTTDLYCRNDAGKNKKALCLIPKGTIVRCFGYYNLSDGVVWPYIQFVMDGVQYTGFSSSKYLAGA